MRKLLLVLPFLLAACESAPRYLVAGPDQSVTVLGRDWTVTKISQEPLYYRAVRDQTEYFLFGPPARTKTSQAIGAIEASTGCKVIRSTLYREVSDHFFAQVDCGAAAPESEEKFRIYTSSIL